MSTITELLGMTPEELEKFMRRPRVVSVETDPAEIKRLASVALRESIGAPITQDWQEAALKVCRAILARDD